MKKVFGIWSMTMLLVMCVGFSSCGGGSSSGSNKKITTKEDVLNYIKGKDFSGSNSSGAYMMVSFDSSNKTCWVRFSMPPPQDGWLRIGETFTYEVRDNLEVVMTDKDGSYTFDVPTRTFKTWTDGDFKMREGNLLAK